MPMQSTTATDRRRVPGSLARSSINFYTHASSHEDVSDNSSHPHFRASYVEEQLKGGPCLRGILGGNEHATKPHRFNGGYVLLVCALPSDN
jgi:hypothetical protein